MKTLLVAIVALLATSYTFAQKAKNADKKIKESTVTSFQYTCPMHSDIKSDNPGNCSKCGMKLIGSAKEQMKTKEMNSYTCSMHPEVQSDTAGTCPKCGMDLHASKKEQMKDKVMNGYSCPMHPNEKSGKPGTCSKCGMKLTKNS